MTLKLVPEVNQRSTKDTLSRSYYIYNDDHATHVDETNAITLSYQQFQIDTTIAGTNHNFNRESDHSCRVVVEWSPGKFRRLNRPDFDENGRAIQWRFSFQAQGQLVRHAIDRRFAINADPTTFPRNVVGVAKVGGVYTPRGEQVAAPSPTFTANLHVSSDEMDATLIRNMGLICGTVAQGDRSDPTKNPNDFENLPELVVGGMTFEEGEIFLSSISGGQVDSDRWIINLGLAFAPNVRRTYDLTVGGVTTTHNYDKQGHDHLWVYEDLDEVQFLAPGGSKVLIPVAKALFVDQVWYYEDWSQIKLPDAYV